MAQEESANTAKAQAFAERLLTILNDGALCLMISIGHRTGLLDAMRDAAPSSSAEIAARAGLSERYVREWLGAMVTGRIVNIDPARNRFSLPPEHAAFLTRAAGADNIGVFAQYMRCSAAWKTRSSNVSKKAAEFHTPDFRGFMKSWRKIAGSPCCHRWKATFCR